MIDIYCQLQAYQNNCDNIEWQMEDMKVLMKCLNKSNIYYMSVVVEGVFPVIFNSSNKPIYQTMADYIELCLRTTEFRGYRHVI